MKHKKITLLLLYSLVCGMIQAFTFAVSIEGKINFETLGLPSALTSTLIGGVIGGLVLSPVMIWVLRNRRTAILVLCLYFFTILVTLSLNLLEVRFSAFISLGAVIGTLVSYHLLRPIQSASE